MQRWAGKAAIVTGASAGIGAVLAKKLVEAGLNVAGFARDVENIQNIAKNLGNNRDKLHGVKCDMMVESDILAGFEWVADHLGPVHILVNNAGYARHSTLRDGETATWKTIVDTNLMGPAIATREAVRAMTIHKNDGHIVHVNSIGGNRHFSKSHMYGATKHGLTNMAEVLRFELLAVDSKIKLTSIYPGIVDTEMLKTGNEEVEKLFLSGPKLNPEAVADAIMYALSTPPDVQIAHLTIQPLGESF